MRIWSLLLVLATVGCSLSIKPGSAGGSGGGSSPAGPAPTAVIASSPDYVGLPSTLDGSGSSSPDGLALAYAWTIVSAPLGSMVTGSGSDPVFSFVGDLGGDYTISLTVTTPTGARGVSSATVTVPTLPVFYRQELLVPGSDQFSLGVVRSDGSGAHAISCPVVVSDAGDAGASNKSRYGDTPEGVGTRVFYPAAAGAGDGAAVVFTVVTPTEMQLLAGGTASDCTQAPPRRLDATPAVPHRVPRFSPDGSRVAFIDAGSTTQLITVALDGSARHVVRTAAKLKVEPPVWLDAATVAWVEDASANDTPELQIVSASDADGAGDGSGRALLVDCPQASDPSVLGVISQFDRVGTSWILSGGIASRFANPPGAIELYRLAGNSCSTTAAITLASKPAGGFAWDFAASPDGSTVALAAMEAGGSTNDLFLVPVDGSVPPSRFDGSAPAVDDVGPIWIAGGRQILWTQMAADGTPRGGGLMIANRDGSGVRSLLAPSASGGSTTFVGGALNRGLDCSAGGRGAAGGEAALLGLALWLAARRRRPAR